MAQTAIDAAMSSKMLNVVLPTGAAGVPGTWTALGASAMKLKLTSTLSTGSASGTEITGSGYTAGGTAFASQCTASSAGSNVTMPAVAAMSWTNGGSAWSIVSLEVTDSAALRVWWGAWSGQPIAVANGNTFQVAVAAISAGGF